MEINRTGKHTQKYSPESHLIYAKFVRRTTNKLILRVYVFPIDNKYGGTFMTIKMFNASEPNPLFRIVVSCDKSNIEGTLIKL